MLPTWSPDGTKLAFWAIHINKGLYVVDVAHPEKLQKLLQESHAHELAWSPNGQLIAYVVSDYETDSFVGIYAVDSGGSSHMVQADLSQEYVSVSWSPDSHWLAVVRADENEDTPQTDPSYIVLFNLDEKTKTTLLVDNPRCAVWLPDGHIAFTGNPNGQIGIFTVDVATGAITTLSNERAQGCPAWSSDGSRIAFLVTKDE